jgi:hypothetical protein
MTKDEYIIELRSQLHLTSQLLSELTKKDGLSRERMQPMAEADMKNIARLLGEEPEEEFDWDSTLIEA